MLAVWHNGSALFSINVDVVTLRRARLVLGWVSAGGFKFCRAIRVFNQIPRSNQPGIPPWIGILPCTGHFAQKRI